MLASAGFGDDAPLSHAFRQKALAERIVDLVCASVEKVFTLQVDLRPAELFGKPFCEVEWRGSASEVCWAVALLCADIDDCEAILMHLSPAREIANKV